MREAQRLRLEFRWPLALDIEAWTDSGDDIPTALRGVRNLQSDPEFRKPVFKLPNEKILPRSDRRQGRPEMDLRSITAPGIVKPA